MTETVLDVLVYLFENYMDEETTPAPDEDALRLELEERGFAPGEISKAFKWLEGLATQSAQGVEAPVRGQSPMRVFTDEELERLDAEARGFLLYLEQNGILDQETRELVIDRAMVLDDRDIDLDRLRWVVLLVLFNQPGREAAFVWMHELVYDSPEGIVH